MHRMDALWIYEYLDSVYLHSLVGHASILAIVYPNTRVCGQLGIWTLEYMDN